MATKRQQAMHTGGGGHDGAVQRGDVDLHGKTVPHPVFGSVRVSLTKDEKHALHDQAVKDGRTQDAHDIHAHLDAVHGGGDFHGRH